MADNGDTSNDQGQRDGNATGGDQPAGTSADKNNTGGQKGAASGAAGGKDALLADLAKERDKRQALEKSIADMQQAQKDQMSKLAQAFGLTSADDGATGADALAQQVTDLQQQFAATQRKATILELAAAPGEGADGKPLPAIPPEYHHLLTATDADALAAQAKSVAELVALKAAQQQTPGFAVSAGQGQQNGGETSLDAQIAAAEKELQGKTLGSVEHRQAQRRLMSLKTQQLAASRQS